MSNYEDAPATKILATHCACCGRPLLDSISVETGVGPDCRKKHGFDEAQEKPDWTAFWALNEAHALGFSFKPAGDDDFGAAHKASNVLVHRVAIEQSGPSVGAYTNAIRALGYVKLAERLAKRLAKVQISIDGADFVIKAPYSEEAVAAFRAVPGRRWDKEAKANRVPGKYKPALWTALVKAYGGHTALGPKGLFVIEEEAS